MSDPVLIKAPATIALGTIPTLDNLRSTVEIVSQFGYSVVLSVTDGVMTATAKAPEPPLERTSLSLV